MDNQPTDVTVDMSEHRPTTFSHPRARVIDGKVHILSSEQLAAHDAAQYVRTNLQPVSISSAPAAIKGDYTLQPVQPLQTWPPLATSSGDPQLWPAQDFTKPTTLHRRDAVGNQGHYIETNAYGWMTFMSPASPGKTTNDIVNAMARVAANNEALSKGRLIYQTGRRGGRTAALQSMPRAAMGVNTSLAVGAMIRQELRRRKIDPDSRVGRKLLQKGLVKAGLAAPGKKK